MLVYHYIKTLYKFCPVFGDAEVARSNRVAPTEKSPHNEIRYEGFLSIRISALSA